MQTGAQTIAGFLLTLPFQNRVAELGHAATTRCIGNILLVAMAIVLLTVFGSPPGVDPIQETPILGRHRCCRDIAIFTSDASSSVSL